MHGIVRSVEAYYDNVDVEGVKVYMQYKYNTNILSCVLSLAIWYMIY